MDLQLHWVNDRLKANREAIGTAAFRNGPEAIRSYRIKAKMRKLDEHEVPEGAKSIQKFSRQPLNLKALDNVGIDLYGNRGTDNFNVAMQAPPPILSAPGQSMMASNTGNYPPMSNSNPVNFAPQQGRNSNYGNESPRPAQNVYQGGRTHQPPQTALPPPPPNSNRTPPPPPMRESSGYQNQSLSSSQRGNVPVYNVAPPPPPMDSMDEYPPMENPPPPPFDDSDLPPPPPNF